MQVIHLQEDMENMNPSIKECMDFLTAHGGENISLGRHDVADSGIYVNVSEYETRTLNESTWEAHKEYCDLQVVLDGREHLMVSNIDTMEIGAFHPESDYLECTGNSEQAIELNRKVGVLLMPEDAHMPGVCIDNEPAMVKKCVFKIPLRCI